jgi:NADPH:quinone reductase-like Zn-dependent oxidoreductase
MPYPHAAENDVVVRVYAAGFTPGELDWPATWSDRAGRDRTPSVPGHELSGVVADFTVAAALPISGLTAWQGLFDHARLTTGQTVLIHGAAGGVGSPG